MNLFFVLHHLDFVFDLLTLSGVFSFIYYTHLYFYQNVLFHSFSCYFNSSKSFVYFFNPCITIFFLLSFPIYSRLLSLFITVFISIFSSTNVMSNFLRFFTGVLFFRLPICSLYIYNIHSFSTNL